MGEDLNRNAFHEAIDTTLSGLQGDPFLARRILNQERTGEPVVKKRLSVGLVLALVLVMIAVTALAVALLSPREVVEQVAVPMAQENDKEWRIVTDFSPEALAEFIRQAGENGIDLDENHAIMQAIRNGEGYDEEEAIMAVCRAAFGGNYDEWTLAERHWFQDMMVSIGWAFQNNEPLPGPDDLTEEEARARLLAAIRAEYGELPLEDRAQYAVSLTFDAEEGTAEGDVWTLTCRPRDDAAEAFYTASLNRAGQVVYVDRVAYGRPQTLEERGYVYTLTEEEAVALAAEGIRSQTGVDVPLTQEGKYHDFTYRTSDPLGWSVSFISHTPEWGRCEAFVDDTTREVKVISAEVGQVTADNILARYRSAHGWYDGWDSTVWAEVAAEAAALPASTMEGRVVKATPWIAWREGLLTRDQAEEKAFRQAGVKMGDVNCASLIDAEPNPVWKFRLLPWDGSYQDSIVVEIDAVTGEMTDLDLYKSDYQDLEPSFHMVTLHRIWARLELEENGPLYLARMAVLKKFADMTYDMPEVYDLPIFDARYWRTEIDGRRVRFVSLWAGQPDYEVELDGNGVAVRVEEKPSSGTEEMPEELNRESLDETMYEVDSIALAGAQAEYGVDTRLWPLEVQMAVYPNQGRTVPREGEMSLREAIAFARAQLPEEAAASTENATVGANLYRIDAGSPEEFTRWTIFFYMDDKGIDTWRVTFVDKHPEGVEYGVDVKEPGDTGNG